MNPEHDVLYRVHQLQASRRVASPLTYGEFCARMKQHCDTGPTVLRFPPADVRPVPKPARRPRFQLGRLFITPAAAAALPHKEVLHALARHASGDWGTVVGKDWPANERALQAGGRLLSADPKTRLLVIPPPTGIYHKREECWYRHPASLFTAPELCGLIDFVHAGGSLLAFAYRFGDAFTQTNLGLLAPAFGCLLNDDAILDLRQLKAPHPLATHFDTTVDELPGVWVVAGIRTLRWRCMATFSILPRARAWPLVLSPALGSVSYHARLRQISYQSLPLGVAGTLGKGRFAFFGGPHAFETTPLGLLARAHNARFLRHVLAWLLAEPAPDRGNTPPPAFGNPRSTDDWPWRPFPSGESECPDGVSVAFVERLLKQGETLKALPIEKWSV